LCYHYLDREEGGEGVIGEGGGVIGGLFSDLKFKEPKELF